LGGKKEIRAKVHPGLAFRQNGKYTNMSEGRGMKIAEGGHWSLQSLGNVSQILILI
jgi:hypothetical protein